MVNLNTERMEEQALLYRAELRSIDYQKANQCQRKRERCFWNCFPNLKLSLGGYYSSNSFFLYQNWLGYASQVSWNLVSAFRMPAKLKAVEAHRQVLDAQSTALTLTILDGGPCRCVAVRPRESRILHGEELPRNAIGDHRPYQEFVAHEEHHRPDPHS